MHESFQDEQLILMTVQEFYLVDATVNNEILKYMRTKNINQFFHHLPEKSIFQYQDNHNSDNCSQLIIAS